MQETRLSLLHNDALRRQLEARDKCCVCVARVENRVKWIVCVLLILEFVALFTTSKIVLFLIGSAFILTLAAFPVYVLFVRIRVARELQTAWHWFPDRSIYKTARQILRLRPSCDHIEYSASPDGDRRGEEIVGNISRIIIAHMELPADTVFYPDDPFPLLCCDGGDGMNMTEAIIALEQYFHVDIPDEMMIDYSFTLHDLADYIMANTEKSPPVPEGKNRGR